jgi:hypothetical protein
LEINGKEGNFGTAIDNSGTIVTSPNYGNFGRMSLVLNKGSK